jgi:rare lipoprotein A
MKMHKIVEIILITLLFYNCSSHKRFTRHGGSLKKGRATKAQPVLNIRPGSVFQEGAASFYAHDFHGRKTANGERFNMNDLTAAHKTLPFDTRVKVVNMDNGMSVIVRINDRGPYAKGRIIDLSLGAAKRIELIGPGSARVKLIVIE